MNKEKINEIQVEYIAPYLPYKLRMAFRDSETGNYIEKGTMTSINYFASKTYSTKIAVDFFDSEYIWMYKPILRPMSLLFTLNEDGKENEWLCRLYDECINPYPFFENSINNPSDLLYAMKLLEIAEIPYTIVNKLFEWHFDVFNLIENDLAILIDE